MPHPKKSLTLKDQLVEMLDTVYCIPPGRDDPRRPILEQAFYIGALSALSGLTAGIQDPGSKEILSEFEAARVRRNVLQMVDEASTYLSREFDL